MSELLGPRNKPRRRRAACLIYLGPGTSRVVRCTLPTRSLAMALSTFSGCRGLSRIWNTTGSIRVPRGSFGGWLSFRLIRFDKRGTGLSDRVAIPTLEERMDDVRAVLDATGSSRAALIGVSEGGTMSILYAAT